MDEMARSSCETKRCKKEYALTVFALLAIVLALGLLWRAGQDGTLATLVEAAASHGFDAGGLIDISLY